MKRASASDGRSSRGRVLSYLGQVALVVAIYVGISAWQTRTHLESGAAAAPDFELRSLSGATVRLSELRDKSVVLHFWATWCGVCKMEISGLKSLVKSLDPDQVLVSVVADADDEAQVRRFVQEHEIDYPVLLADEKILSQYRVTAFPTTYFLAPDGSIDSSTVGLSNRFAYRARLGCAR